MTSRHLILPAIALALLTARSPGQMNQEFVIEKIVPELIKSPDFNIGLGPQKRSTSKDWLEVEVDFTVKPRPQQQTQGIPPLEELTFNYYILLNNAGPGNNPPPTLLTGQVTHVAVGEGKGKKSVMYVSPRTLEHFFRGKSPSTAKSAVMAIGVTITRQGQLVAQESFFSSQKAQPGWWTQFQQTAGYVLNKNETPFSPLFWDYYEAIKSETGS